jgi:hydroxymethylpyrimidine kinase/phosphomethylpyrimidine kinase
MPVYPGERDASELTNGHAPQPIVLTIAGFDPCGGAGIAADLKTIAAHGCYGVAAVTALTVQNSQGVKSVHLTPASTLRAQLEALAEDVTIAAVKIGMLGSKPNAQAVSEWIERGKPAHVVLDPVAKAQSGGAPLIENAALKFLTDDLMKRCTVVTPNIFEAELLTGMEIKDLAGMKAAAEKILARGARAVVVKGGHMEKAIDVYFDGTEMETFGGDRVKSENTHGSGCTLASAMASQLALGRPLREAVMLSKAYVTKAIERGFAIGKGPGPLDHFYRMRQEPLTRGTHEVPQHGMHPAAEAGGH